MIELWYRDGDGVHYYYVSAEYIESVYYDPTNASTNVVMKNGYVFYVNNGVSDVLKQMRKLKKARH